MGSMTSETLIWEDFDNKPNRADLIDGEVLLPPNLRQTDLITALHPSMGSVISVF